MNSVTGPCCQVLPDIVQGDTPSYSIQIEGVDLTGDSFIMTAKKKLAQTDGDALFQRTAAVPAGQDAIDGKYAFSLLSADTENGDVGEYYYDLKWLKAGGERITLYYGKFELLASVATSL